MTTLRPERGAEDPMSYQDTGAFRAVVESMNDPLNDPLPGRAPAAPGRAPAAPGRAPAAPGHASAAPEPAPERGPGRHAAGPGPREQAAYGPAQDAPGTVPPRHDAQHPRQRPHAAEPAPAAEGVDETVPMAVLAAGAAAYRAAPDAPGGFAPEAPAPDRPGHGRPAPDPFGPGAPAHEPYPPAPAMAPAPPAAPPLTRQPDGPGAPGDGGRAARRKAARQGAGGHRAAGRTPSGTAPDAERPAVPLSRVEARRAARAAKDSPAVVLSRVVGELFITLGLVMLLFVTYQLWWTNVRAHQQASSASNNLEQQWSTTSQDPDRNPGAFSPGQGFAIMYIPKLDVKAPIAQGVSKSEVLDHGMIGHYDGQPVNTAMPWDKTGNFAVAAHRNTHGEPFRYINHLAPGDKIVVETATTYYTYVVTNTLPSTPPSDIDVLDPVPPGSGFTGPGRYITLTTCTPEFTSTNRLIVWGKLAQEQPRSKGKPDALMNG